MPLSDATSALFRHLDSRPGHDEVKADFRQSLIEEFGKEGIAQSQYHTWSKEFMEAGKRRLAGDTARAATTGQGSAPRSPRVEGMRCRPFCFGA